MKRILVCMTGLSPQVVTETLYALVTRKDPFYPDEVWLASSVEGRDLAKKALLERESGHLWRLVRDFSLPLAPKNIHLTPLLGRDGKILPDIRTARDNEDAADGILNLVRKLTADPETTVHVSLSGGRKTMSFYAGYALSLFGRLQDRLSHVLVSPEFEFCPDFFYPARIPGEQRVQNRWGEWMDTFDATVTLAEIPFVHLRSSLPPDLLEGTVGFSESVRLAQKAFQSPELIIDLRQKRIRAGEKVIPLPPTQLAFLAWFARRVLSGLPPIACPKGGVGNEEYAREYLRVYQEIVGEMGGADRTRNNLVNGMEQEFFEQTASKLHEKLARVMGKGGSRPYRIEGTGTRHKTSALTLSSGQIRFGRVLSEGEER
ncbi:CRISPR-associated ring nuclease Csm6 [Leptospirillum ferriphilum]|nr:CRISPR-associated ring nuclease Csm6 [Leptospirillum ferriphilum]